VSDTAPERVSRGTFRRDVVSFARREGRISHRPLRAWDADHASYLVQPPRVDRDTSLAADWVLDAASIFGRVAPVVLEIGTGTGDAILAAAAAHPDIDHVAVEVYRPGLAQTIVRARQEGLTNLRVLEVDAAELLLHGLPPAGVTEVRVFFPDPWPKNKHRKRRLVDGAFFETLADALVPGGVVRLATDWAGYASAMRDAGEASPSFRNPHAGERATPSDARGGWAPRYDGRPLTRFEQKGLELRRTIHDLTFIRTE
jgi:tRNA (guanine-N7-)-methyltransferase